MECITFDSVNIIQGLYGTRSSAALTVRSRGEANFYEVYLDDTKWKEHAIDFHIGKLNYKAVTD